MEVSNVQQFTSSVTIGAQQHIAMGISDSPEFFQILSASLYKNPKLAMVREVICNAWDAHIAAGKEDTPVSILLQNSTLIIRDYGHGIPHDLIGQIYGVYGGSTKKKESGATGGFGLGCKSPFAYQDTFIVTSFHAGRKVVYSMNKSSIEHGGRPAIIPMVDIPTDQTGIEVKIQIKPHDSYDLLAHINLVVENGQINAVLNHKELPVFDYSECVNGYALTQHSTFGYGNNSSPYSIWVKYGAVVYPVDRHPSLEDLCQDARTQMNLARLDQRAAWMTPHLVLLAPPDSISVAPSRDSLSMQANTIKTIKGLLEVFLEDCKKSSQYRRGYMLERIQTSAKKETFTRLFQGIIDYAEPIKKVVSAETFQKAVANKRTLAPDSYSEEIVRSLSAHIDMKKMGNSLISLLCTKSPEYFKWMYKHFFQKIREEVLHDPRLNIGRLSYFLNGEFYPTDGGRYISQGEKRRACFGLARKLAVVTYRQSDMADRLSSAGMDSTEARIVYLAPRNKTAAPAAVAIFEKLGYTVLDMTKPIGKECPDEVAPISKPAIAKEPRQKEILSLDLSTRLEKPLFTVEVPRSSMHLGLNYHYKLSKWEKKILSLYGKKAAFVHSYGQTKLYREKGCPTYEEFFTRLAKSKEKDKNFMAHAALIQKNDWQADIAQFQECLDILKFPLTELSEEDQLTLNLVLKEHMWDGDYSFSQAHSNLKLLKLPTKVFSTSEKFESHPFRKFIVFGQSSDKSRCIDMANLVKLLTRARK